MSHSEITRRVGSVGLLTLLSRMSGLLRDIFIANIFGTRMAADAFFVAFRIPNLLRRLFAEGALTLSFVPVFTMTFRKNRAEAKRLVDVSWTLLALLLASVTLLGILFAPWIVRFIAWGFSSQSEKFELTVFLTRIVFPYIFFVSLAAWGMGILNSLKHFAIPAASPILLNLGIILGTVFLSRVSDPPVLGLAIGVLIGGALQLGIHFPFLRSFGFRPQICWDPHHPGVQKMVSLMIPAAFGAAVYQFNVIVITLLASFLPSGSVSYLWYADRLMEFPLGIWGIALATVLLPSFSDHVVDKDIPGFKKTFRYGLKMVFFLTIPASAGLILLGGLIIRLLFEHGSFDSTSTLETTHALWCFSLGLPFIAAVRITSNAFFSFQDSKTPVKIASLSVVLNLFLSIVLMRFMAHAGLALAVSLAAGFNFLAQLYLLRKKIGFLGLRKILGAVGRITMTTGLMTVGILFLKAPLLSLTENRSIPDWLALLLLILIGKGIFLCAERLFKSEELQDCLQILRRRRRS